jgi:hypothetical protein
MIAIAQSERENISFSLNSQQQQKTLELLKFYLDEIFVRLYYLINKVKKFYKSFKKRRSKIDFLNYNDIY